MMSKGRSKHGLHPAERFTAPVAIQRGSPLCNLIGRRSVELLAESIIAVVPTFNAGNFKRHALRGLGKFGLMQRAAHVATALANELPSDFNAAARVLVASLGPELQATEGNGLAPFFYLPHSHVIASRGVDSLKSGLGACYELTKRFTAEFCIRPFLLKHQTETLRVLSGWAKDPNPHVRRLVSEGTRPRLPWGIRLRPFQDDPRPTLALLEVLKDDSVPYVQRSVANHLGDVLKDNPEIAYSTCERWIDEFASLDLDHKQIRLRLWAVRHALRLPAKNGEPRAIQLRQAAKGSR